MDEKLKQKLIEAVKVGDEIRQVSFVAACN